MRIQIDMFAVELGAALLLQFDLGHDVVRVLADAGESKHDVNARLSVPIADFGGEPLRIDLLIGTHYDSDHLDGLVAIIENDKISIGEAWLPPVVNDTQPHTQSETPDGALLPLQLRGEDGELVLERYLTHKSNLCDRLAAAERRGDEVRGIARYAADFQGFGLRGETRGRRAKPSHERLSRAYFQAHLADAERTMGKAPAGHADEPISDPWDISDRMELTRTSALRAAATVETLSRSWLRTRSARADVEAPSIALVRRAAAKAAINAHSLNDVVAALKARRVPMRCSTIDDGQPRTFHWTPSSRRFCPVRTAESSEPAIVLLGPSDGLVKKHWDALPVGDYVATLAFLAIPIEPITPSNQLSYIMAFEHAGQRILVSGDAGCVDFKPGTREPYYPDLLSALAPLHVVQVAHHAGHNAHFYRCLLESNYRTQKEPSFLLLSHATQDKHRPSTAFTKFLEGLSKSPDQVRLLFTSTPREAKVRDAKPFIAGVTGGPPRSASDVRLLFDGAVWNVIRHQVQVA